MAKTAYRKPKKKVHVFDIVNYIVFILLVLVPIWKVVVDSFNAVGVYQFRLWPEDFTLDGYKTIIHTQRLYRPFINSVITTVLGTFLGLLLSTLGGYVLIQFDMPGRNFFAYFLLFTMIFSGGMIPEYLVMKQLHLVNSMWILVVKHGMDVYNLVLMRNFFEGIPASLFEAAEIDGCSPMGIFFKIVLPLSKAVIAVIALWAAVGQWNSYFNALIYIRSESLQPLQIVLRSILVGNQTMSAMSTGAAAVEAKQMADLIKYAIIVVSSAPIMCMYPLVQKYFNQGVMLGSLKG